MKKKTTTIAIAIALILTSCTKIILPDGVTDRSTNMVPQIENHLSPDGYNIYRSVIGTDTAHYFNAQTLLSFNATYGQQSLNIFDLDGDQMVTSSDFLIVTSSYGQTAPFNWDLYQCEIFGQFSSGWFMDHPEWDAIFLKPTPQDELNNDYTPDELKSFVIEGSIDGVNHKIWYYKK